MNSLEDLKVGLETLREKCNSIQNKKLSYLLELYGQLQVLVNKCMAINDSEILIVYPAQDLQMIIYEEIQKRINK
ncbi:hypothetical protein ACTQ4K_04875 [Clostridium sporogenes]|uniref:hypothetical protein n=1 Tax=Clostridium sporogenes TaxID=1509 RepID=UPI003F8FCC92